MDSKLQKPINHIKMDSHLHLPHFHSARPSSDFNKDIENHKVPSFACLGTCYLLLSLVLIFIILVISVGNLYSMGYLAQEIGALKGLGSGCTDLGTTIHELTSTAGTETEGFQSTSTITTQESSSPLISTRQSLKSTTSTTEDSTQPSVTSTPPEIDTSTSEEPLTTTPGPPLQNAYYLLQDIHDQNNKTVSMPWFCSSEICSQPQLRLVKLKIIRDSEPFVYQGIFLWEKEMGKLQVKSFLSYLAIQEVFSEYLDKANATIPLPTLKGCENGEVENSVADCIVW